MAQIHDRLQMATPFILRCGARVGAVGLCVASAFGQGDVYPGRAYTVGNHANTVEVGDLDGDGNLDVMVGQFQDPPISFFLNSGLGQFTLSGSVSGGFGTGDILFLDLTNDGLPDIVSTSRLGNLLQVFVGLGGGGFGPPVLTGTPAYPTHAAASDFNLDGNTDIVVNIGTVPYLAVFLGDGMAGLFEQPPIAALNSAGGVKAGDVNADGIPDILTSDRLTNQLTLILGTGAHAFAPPQSLTTGKKPTDVAIVDLNVDGLLDLASANTTDSTISVHLAASPGVYQPHAEFPYEPAIGDDAAGIVSLAIADLDVNGLPDAVVTNSYSGVVALLHGIGGGALGQPATLAAGGGGSQVACADLNGDGLTDVAIASVSAGLAIYNGTPGGTIPTSKVYSPPYLSTLALGDFDKDGIADAAGTDYTGAVSTMFGDGSGGFMGGSTFPVGLSPKDVASADLDSDGDLDLLTADSNPSAVSVWLGVPIGDFIPGGSYSVGGPSFGAVSPRSLAIGDVNLDGKLDVATANASTGNVSILLGNGFGGFSAPNKVAVGGMSPLFVLFADFDVNGLLDLATANADSGTTSVLVNSGHGFAAPSILTTGYYTNNLAADDLSSDGIVDLVVGNNTGNSLVLVGNGLGGFPTSQVVSVGAGSRSIDIGDVNIDGIADFVSANYGGGFAVALGTGGLGFDVGLYVLPSGADQIALADLDGDGRLEVIGSGGALYVSKGLLDTPTSVQPYGTGTPGCLGTLGVMTNSVPHVNNPQFAFAVTNGTPNALGLGIATDTLDEAGSDPFGLGLLLHVDLFAASEVHALNIDNNANGDGFAPAPIPNDPALVGLRYYFQAIEIEALGFQCSPSPIHLTSSKGLALTIVP